MERDGKKWLWIKNKKSENKVHNGSKYRAFQNEEQTRNSNDTLACVQLVKDPDGERTFRNSAEVSSRHRLCDESLSNKVRVSFDQSREIFLLTQVVC